MKIWDIDPKDKTAVDLAGRECPIDPMTGDPKVPHGVMSEAPPAAGDHEVAVVSGGQWALVPDWRGHVYWTEDGEQQEITVLGVAPPETALESEPAVAVAKRVIKAQRAIDRAAGRARNRFISPGELIDAEYVHAEKAARTFADAGYSGTVPPSVQSWADAAGMTSQQAADDILATAQQWRDLLDQIRAVRLAGKAAVDAASASDVESTAQTYIDQLDAMAPA